MVSNKLDGLKFLKKTFAKEKDVGVLPWRVYSKPWQVMPEHFKGAERILVRSDLNLKEIAEYDWARLPRKDATERTLKQTMKKIHEKCKPKLKSYPYKSNFRFIVHAVEKRSKEHYSGFIEFRPVIGEAHVTYFAISRQADAGNKIWREGRKFINKMGERDAILSEMEEKGLNRKHAEKAYSALMKAVELMKNNGREKIFIPSRTILTAFTIQNEEKVRKGKPVIEFYDLQSRYEHKTIWD